MPDPNLLRDGLADDWQRFDRLEMVDVYAPGEATPTAVDGALRRASQRRQHAPSDGAYHQTDVAWHLPQSLLATPPVLGTRLIDAAGQAWSVLEVEEATLQTRWACQCRRLAIEDLAENRVTIQRATILVGTHGEPAWEWHDWLSDRLARVQPLERDNQQQHGQWLSMATHRVYLADDLELGAQDRIVQGTRLLAVLRQRRPSRLEGWTEVECRQTPWPWAVT